MQPLGQEMPMKPLALFAAACAAFVPAAVTADGAMPQGSNTLAEVKFQFDSAQVPGDARTQIERAAQYAASHATARIVLDAHCDPIGSGAYNAGLATRRAESVWSQLVAAGVPEDQIVISVYGEDGAHRASYADDRRVTVWWTTEPLARVTDQAFAAHSTAVRWGRDLTVAEIQATPEPVASR
jgi:outer membrane protein OmpA-like peptidoglycan-associated protein